MGMIACECGGGTARAAMKGSRECQKKFELKNFTNYCYGNAHSLADHLRTLNLISPSSLVPVVSPYLSVTLTFVLTFALTKFRQVGLYLTKL